MTLRCLRTADLVVWATLLALRLALDEIPGMGHTVMRRRARVSIALLWALVGAEGHLPN